MTNPRDPEGLMPDAGVDGPPVNPDGELPFDGAAMDGGLDRDALTGRTDPDEPSGDAESRFPGASDDVTMTTGDAGSGFGAGVVAADDATEAAGE
jgi:hypothetical protein